MLKEEAILVGPDSPLLPASIQRWGEGRRECIYLEEDSVPKKELIVAREV